MSGGGSERRPPHLIRRSEVSAWLAGSAVSQITEHWTDTTSATQIREDGVRMEATAIGSKWGQGFYTSSRPLPEYGEGSVRVALRLLHPLIVDDQIAAQEYIDELLVQAGTEDVRLALLAADYDGVVINWASGEVWAIAFESEQVKVIQEG